MKKNILFLLAALTVPVISNAQLDPIYSQYINNPLIINPAYAGSNNMFNAGIQYRSQWAGIEANPSTLNFNSHISLYQNKLGVGLLVTEDKIGDTKNTEFSTAYSYKIELDNAFLSFGLQTGFIRFTNSPSKLTIFDPDDPAFNAYAETKFNTGAGLLLKSDRYIIGLSAPRLLPATINQGGESIQVYSQNYYVFGSYVFFVSDNIRFKPSVLLRATKGASISTDVNASVNFKELYTAGVFTRNFKTYGLLAQMIFKKYKLGYVLEVPGTKSSSLHFTSHEITLGISLKALRLHDSVTKTF